jgi:hypothetical membrane protein
VTSQIRLGAVFWVLTVEFFVGQFVAQAAWPGYSMTINDISLLGVTACGGYANPAPDGIEPVCSPLNLLFNAGMAINGVLVVLGAWLTRNVWPSGRLSAAALIILGLGGLGTSMAGLFPLDVSVPLHTLGAALALGLACFGVCLLGTAVWRTHRLFAIYSLATGVIALLGFVLYVAEMYVGGRGTIERVAAWPQTLWYMVTGALILAGYFRISASSHR